MQMYSHLPRINVFNKSLDPKFLSQLITSLSMAVKGAIGVSMYLSVALQQARRDALTPLGSEVSFGRI